MSDTQLHKSQQNVRYRRFHLVVHTQPIFLKNKVLIIIRTMQGMAFIASKAFEIWVPPCANDLIESTVSREMVFARGLLTCILEL